MVEHRSPKPGAAGSSPSAPANKYRKNINEQNNTYKVYSWSKTRNKQGYMAYQKRDYGNHCYGFCHGSHFVIILSWSRPTSILWYKTYFRFRFIIYWRLCVTSLVCSKYSLGFWEKSSSSHYRTVSKKRPCWTFFWVLVPMEEVIEVRRGKKLMRKKIFSRLYSN